MRAQALIIRAAGLVNTELKTTHWPLFFTLTYRDNEEWNPKQISKFIDNYRVFIKRNGHPKEKLTYIWTAENHKKRDYIHYHGIIWIPNGVLPPKPDNQGWWKYGSSNVQKARNPAAYIAKYIGKSSEPLKLPPKGRSHSINVRNIVNLDYLKIPSWLAYYCKMGDKVKRVRGYGFVNFTTQKCYDSPFRFSKLTGCRWFGWFYPEYAEKEHKGRCGYELNHFDEWLIMTGRKPEVIL